MNKYKMCTINGDSLIEAESADEAMAVYRADCKRFHEMVEDEVCVYLVTTSGLKRVKTFREE